MTESRILIVERDPLVALDLTQTIDPLIAGSMTIVASTLDEVEAQLESAGRLTLTLLDVSNEEIRNYGLIAQIRKVSDAVILLDSFAAEAVQLIDNLIVVRRPFNSAMVEEAVAMARDKGLGQT